MFTRLCAYLDSSDECQYSLGELEKIIIENGDKPFSRHWLKTKLLLHYDKGVFITERPGKDTVVNFSGFVNNLLYDKWYGYEEKLANKEDKNVE